MRAHDGVKHSLRKPPAEDGECAACGAPIPGEGYPFTVCDDCWEDHYHNGNTKEGDR